MRSWNFLATNFILSSTQFHFSTSYQMAGSLKAGNLPQVCVLAEWLLYSGHSPNDLWINEFFSKDQN